MSTRAKFYVQSVTDYGDAGGKAVELSPVTRTTDENKAFWEATPSGSIKMHIKTDAADLFKPGFCVYVDFTPTDERAFG